MQTKKEKVDLSKALDASLVDTESSRTESREHDTSSSSGNDAYAVDADIRPIYNEEPMAEENNTDIQAKIQEGGAHIDDDEFINPFCTSIQEVAESSSRNIDPSNMHTFYQPHQSEHQWTKDHPLEQEAMADSTWIEAMHDELHQFDTLQIWELIDKPFDGHENDISKWSIEGGGLCCSVEKYFQTLIMLAALILEKSLGGIQFFSDKLVSWMSKKQDYTAMSSAEAVYVALSASCAQVMWTRTQLKDYGFNYNKIPLYCDSQLAIAISCNPVQHYRTKHIHTRYHFIKEQVENVIIELYFVRTEYQLAVMFTNALLEERFKYLVRRIGMRCLTPAEVEVLEKESA
nr:retrovirus-related Pol polyprotein from transposon TNT 1-94 [Tanacetum cinerariifolium]